MVAHLFNWKFLRSLHNPPFPKLKDRIALRILLRRLEPKLLHQPVDGRLGRLVDPRRAHLHGPRAALEPLRAAAPADAVLGLEQDGLQPSLLRLVRRHQTGETAADDHDVDFSRRDRVSRSCRAIAPRPGQVPHTRHRLDRERGLRERELRDGDQRRGGAARDARLACERGQDRLDQGMARFLEVPVDDVEAQFDDVAGACAGAVEGVGEVRESLFDLLGERVWPCAVFALGGLAGGDDDAAGSIC